MCVGLDADADPLEALAGRVDVLFGKRAHRHHTALPADRPARAVPYHRGVLVDADAAAAWWPEGDPVFDPGGWKTRQEIEVRNDEVAGQDTQAVAQPDTTRHPVLVEVVGRVASLPEHHRPCARASEHRTAAVPARDLGPER